MFKYLLYRGAMAVSTWAPLRLTYWVALRVADLHYVFDREGRRAVRRNVRQVLGPERSERMVSYEARWTFRHFGKYLAEFFRFTRFGSGFVEKHVLMRGIENVEEALSAGHGAILVSAHLGNWELGAHVVAHMGYDVTSIVLEQEDRRVNKLLNEQRTRRGLEILPAGGFLRGCYRALREGKIVALLGDRDVTGGGIEMQFFGKSVSLPQGPARLSVRTGAPIVLSFNMRRPNDSWHLIFEKPIFPDASLDQDSAVRSIMEKYVPILEDYIRWHPSQWAIFYDFWNSGEE